MVKPVKPNEAWRVQEVNKAREENAVIAHRLLTMVYNGSISFEVYAAAMGQCELPAVRVNDPAGLLGFDLADFVEMPNIGDALAFRYGERDGVTNIPYEQSALVAGLLDTGLCHDQIRPLWLAGYNRSRDKFAKLRMINKHNRAARLGTNGKRV